MRLSGLAIDGFGIFKDVELPELPTGLVLLQGNNEAGKSTLLEFIRTILFGFPGGKARHSVPPPLAGGRHGGRLILERAEEPGQIWKVQRYADHRRHCGHFRFPHDEDGQILIVVPY